MWCNRVAHVSKPDDELGPEARLRPRMQESLVIAKNARLAKFGELLQGQSSAQTVLQFNLGTKAGN